ncbi:MAG: aminomethyltransferase [Myxococcota bacterium]|jgi:aminomethyltransferase
MPHPTPFHPRTQALCESYAWKHWSGYYAICHYDESPEREYNAIRQAAGLLDVTPLFKYDITGKDAGRFLSYVLAKPVDRLKVGRITYVCWCDDDGKVLDDGTCWRLAKRHYRLTAAAPSFAWLLQHADPFDVEVVDLTDKIAAVALQGPTSKAIIEATSDVDVAKLGFFGLTSATFGGDSPFTGIVTRTGFTGDLGYEIWVNNGDALALWDLLMRVGKDHGIYPIGLDALDITRIEAGFILHGCDYTGAHDAVIESQKSSPFELGLDWTVKLDRGPFIGQRALKAEKARGSAWAFVGLDINWEATEAHFARYDLPPNIPTHAWRDGIPIYRGMRQIGRATSGTWSPVLKKNLALATVQADAAIPGQIVDIEVTVEWERARVPATVCALPFYDPPRKRE